MSGPRQSLAWAALLAALAPVGATSREAVVSGRLAVIERTVRATITIEAGWHVNAHTPRQDFLIPTTLTITPPPGTRLGSVVYPAPVERAMAFSDEPLLLYDGTVVLQAPIEAGDARGRVRAHLRYQACNETTCLPPRTLSLESGDGGAAHGADPFAAVVERGGWVAAFGLVLVAGLALNLTPCVYPLISVTLAFFGGRTAGDARRTLRLATAYVLGICLTFSTLGVAAALTGSLFGSAMQSPVVLAAIALLMVGLALANFGVYRFRLPQGVTQAAGRAAEGTAGALLMGLTMGIVGAPCIGPFVATLLLYVAAQQSVPLGLALFFVLGVGLGLPYIGLALVAGRVRRLPRGGAWLGWVEWALGFVLLGLALHFVTPMLSAGTVALAWALLIGAAGIALGMLWPVGGARTRWVLRAAGIAVVAYGVTSVGMPQAESPIGWVAYSENRLAEARAQGRPVFIDFEAEWCIPCREMDRTTFRDAAVVQAAEAYTMLKADVTIQDAAAEALMRRFDVPGVPTYLVFDGTGREHRRFVGFVDAEELARALRGGAGDGVRG